MIVGLCGAEGCLGLSWTRMGWTGTAAVASMIITHSHGRRFWPGESSRKPTGGQKAHSQPVRSSWDKVRTAVGARSTGPSCDAGPHHRLRCCDQAASRCLLSRHREASSQHCLGHSRCPGLLGRVGSGQRTDGFQSATEFVPYQAGREKQQKNSRKFKLSCRNSVG
jgi:hypothetical protein